MENQRQTKYVQFAQQLRLQIVSGELRPGERVPSFADMKRLHGISQSTMEKMHLLLEKEGLVVREQGRGTFVAQPPVVAKTGVIGVVIDERFYRHPYYAAMMQGIQSAAYREGMEILLLREESADLWARADGVLLLAPIAGRFRTLVPTMPCVALLRPEVDVPHIAIDEYAAMQSATNYLLELGHKRVGYLAVGGEISKVRVMGFRHTMEKAGFEVPPLWTRQLLHRREIQAKPFFYHNGRISMQRWLDDNWSELGLTALLCQNDETAIGAIEVLQESNVSVPEKLSVMGFDGKAGAEYFRPRLTTMEVPLEEIGAAATEYLLRQIRQPQMRENAGDITLSATLRIGDSTASCLHR